MAVRGLLLFKMNNQNPPVAAPTQPAQQPQQPIQKTYDQIYNEQEAEEQARRGGGEEHMSTQTTATDAMADRSKLEAEQRSLLGKQMLVDPSWQSAEAAAAGVQQKAGSISGGGLSGMGFRYDILAKLGSALGMRRYAQMAQRDIQDTQNPAWRRQTLLARMFSPDQWTPPGGKL